jgi:hypothetical protein
VIFSAKGISQFSDAFLSITEIAQEAISVRSKITSGPLAVEILSLRKCKIVLSTLPLLNMTIACAVGCSDFHFFFIFLGMSHLPSFPWDPRVQKM